MITYSGDILNITCDKCGAKSSCSKDGQLALFNEGWALRPNANKYKHLCYLCQSSSSRKAHDFVKSKFKL